MRRRMNTLLITRRCTSYIFTFTFGSLDLQYTSLPEPALEDDFEAIVSFLIRLKWTSVALGATSITVGERFGDWFRGKDICVTSLKVLPDIQLSTTETIENWLTDLEEDLSEHVLFIGNWNSIWKSLEVAIENQITKTWMLLPWSREPVVNVYDFHWKSLPNLIILKRVSKEVPRLGITSDLYIEHPLTYTVVQKVFRWATKVRKSELKNEDIVHIQPQQPRFEIQKLVEINGTLFYKKIGFYYRGMLSFLETTDLVKQVNVPQCSICSCVNSWMHLINQLTVDIDHKSAILLTLTSIFTVISLASLIYFVMHTCSSDQPDCTFSIFFLLIILLTFGVQFVYILNVNPLVCRIRFACTEICFCLLSTLFSRSILLATTDGHGLLGHISGCIQCVIWSLLVIIQIGISLYSSMHVDFTGLNEDDVCYGSIYDIIFTFTYPSLLLFSQVTVCPFLPRSMRNYKEGQLYTISTILLLIIWTVLATLLAVIPYELSDFIIAIGLYCFPVILLTVIFIPKIYFMMITNAKERTILSLSSVTHPHSVNDLIHASPSYLYYDQMPKPRKYSKYDDVPCYTDWSVDRPISKLEFTDKPGSFTEL